MREFFELPDMKVRICNRRSICSASLKRGESWPSRFLGKMSASGVRVTCCVLNPSHPPPSIFAGLIRKSYGQDVYRTRNPIATKCDHSFRQAAVDEVQRQERRSVALSDRPVN